MVNCVSQGVMRLFRVQRKTTGIVLSLMYLFLVPPALFVICHLRLYDGLRVDGTSTTNTNRNLWIYYASELVSVSLWVLMSIGLLDGGGGGWLQVIKAIRRKKKVAAAIGIFSAATNAIIALIGIYLIAGAIQIHLKQKENLNSTPSRNSRFGRFLRKFSIGRKNDPESQQAQPQQDCSVDSAGVGVGEIEGKKLVIERHAQV